MKIAIQKPVGILGEVWMVEVPVSNDVLKSKDPVAGIKAQTDSALRVLDDRLLDLNLRLIDHNKLAQGLTPEGLLAVRQCVEIMYGSMVGPPQTKVEQPAFEGGDPVKTVSDEKVAAALERALEATDEGGR